MYYTGFADEAAPDISGQIRATKELGWEFIEARNIGGRNIHDITDAEFDDVCGRLSDAGVRINCFGSAIANWAKQVTEPFDSSLEEARRAIPRMRRLGAGLVRVMSLGVLRDRPPTEQMEPERFRRLRELVAMFAAEGITPVHENCANYGGMGAEFTLRMLDAVPGLGLVFDTGNPVFTPDYSKPEPRPRQSAWEFYERVRGRIDYVHVKDGVFVRDTPGSIFPEATFTFPARAMRTCGASWPTCWRTATTAGSAWSPTSLWFTTVARGRATTRRALATMSSLAVSSCGWWRSAARRRGRRQVRGFPLISS